MKKRILQMLGYLTGTILGLAILACLIYLIANYPRKAEPFEFGSANPERSILIATQGSQFKDAFVRVLVDSLQKSPVYVKGIDLRNIGEMQGQEWDKILIVNAFMAILNHDAAEFIEGAQDPQKILLMVTSGGADWQPQPDLKVDAITSASNKSYIPELVDIVHIWLHTDSAEFWPAEDYVLSLRYFPEVEVSAACTDILSKQEFYKAKYPDLVRLINSTGYLFMRLNDLESALKVFKMNLDLFPEVWNVYDSYAEALLKTGDRQAARIHYQQALAMNPQSRSARDALKQLGLHP